MQRALKRLDLASLPVKIDSDRDVVKGEAALI
jgi:hypothetical protein